MYNTQMNLKKQKQKTKTKKRAHNRRPKCSNSVLNASVSFVYSLTSLHTTQIIMSFFREKHDGKTV